MTYDQRWLEWKNKTDANVTIFLNKSVLFYVKERLLSVTWQDKSCRYEVMMDAPRTAYDIITQSSGLDYDLFLFLYKTLCLSKCASLLAALEFDDGTS
jgi:hypothetical protein